jgi:hypothetical protein
MCLASSTSLLPARLVPGGPSASPTSPRSPPSSTRTAPACFASSNDLVVIDLSAAHVWDASSVAALDAIETKDAQRGKTVEITGLNEHSAHLHGRLSGELAGSH